MLTETGVLNSLDELWITRVVTANSSRPGLGKHTTSQKFLTTPKTLFLIYEGYF